MKPRACAVTGAVRAAMGPSLCLARAARRTPTQAILAVLFAKYCAATSTEATHPCLTLLPGVKGKGMWDARAPRRSPSL
jgi:hypothetical protein